MLSDAKKGTYRESRLGKYKHDLICIGSSTGGLPIVQKILKGIELKETTVIICQHVNQQHNSNIMEALERSIKGKYLQVDESTKLKKGFVYILAGGSDYEIKKRYNDYYIDPVGLSDEQYHPSFNVLTKSLIPLNEMNTGCMILSGLGNDGSKYLSELKNNNVKLLVQEPESAVAPYMPKAAIATGKIDHVYNESDLSDYLKRSAA
jgi:chemotaxis response regulator CheB